MLGKRCNQFGLLQTSDVTSTFYRPLHPAGRVFSPRKSRVLAVDDDPGVRALLVRVLEEAGYEVLAVRDGRAAEAIQWHGTFDLILTNSFLNAAPGEQSIGRLRQLFPDLPILHLEDLKPFTLTTLFQAVAVAMADRLYAMEPDGKG